MLRWFGADAVGMSTVPEAIMAKKLGMKVTGLSLISNMGAGITRKPLSHEEVLAWTEDGTGPVSDLLIEIINDFSK